MREAECTLWSASRRYDRARAALLTADVAVKARVTEAEQLLAATAPASLRVFMSWLLDEWTASASPEYVDALDAAWRAARHLIWMESYEEVMEAAVVELARQLP